MAAVTAAAGLLSGYIPACQRPEISTLESGKPVVSIVKIKRDRIGAAAEEAIDLLRGIKAVAKDKDFGWGLRPSSAEVLSRSPQGAR